MKATKFFLLVSLFLLFALALPGAALASNGQANVLPDEFVFGQNYTLSRGNTLQGNLWVLGGNATIEDGATVAGDVNVFGGNLIADGTVTHDINVVGGTVILGSTAIVQNDVNLTGGSLNRQTGARVNGNVNENGNPVRVPGVQIPWFSTPVPWVTGPGIDGSNPFWSLLGYLARSLLVSALAVLVAMFLPRQTERTSAAIVSQPLLSGGLGCITVIIVPIILLALVITIILIPVTFLGFVLLALMVVFGWIAIGLEVGQRMAQMFKTEWALPVAAGLGTLVLTLVVDGIGKIWCIGWVAPALVGVVALGGVLLTRFGTQSYPGPMHPAPVTTSPIAPFTPVSPVITPEPAVEEPIPPAGGETVYQVEEPAPPPGGAAVYTVDDIPPGDMPTIVRPGADIPPEPETPDIPPEQTQ